MYVFVSICINVCAHTHLQYILPTFVVQFITFWRKYFPTYTLFVRITKCPTKSNYIYLCISTYVLYTYDCVVACNIYLYFFINRISQKQKQKQNRQIAAPPACLTAAIWGAIITNYYGWACIMQIATTTNEKKKITISRKNSENLQMKTKWPTYSFLL